MTRPVEKVERPSGADEPAIPPALPWHEVPLVRATPVSLAGYGQLVDDPDSVTVDIVTWPSLGWRPVDQGTGNQGGITSGHLDVWWEGEALHARNSAVDEQSLIGWSRNPGEIQAASPSASLPNRTRVLLWRAGYQPDSSRLIFPVDHRPFIVPLALPGDDITPEDFVAFFVEAGRGLQILPGVWHESALPLGEKGLFLAKQGKVHARISCQFPEEFGVFLSVPVREPRP